MLTFAIATTTMFSFIRALFTPPPPVPASIYDFKVPALDGSVIDFSTFKGRKILIVNTASHCGNTPQYTGLQQLWQQYSDRLVIVGFPSNFFFQEPGGSKAIAEFCSLQYRITFPMAQKVSVVGPAKAPIYRWLTEKRYNHYADSRVKWNFQKYLIDEQGKLIAIFGPKTLPDDPAVLAAING